MSPYYDSGLNCIDRDTSGSLCLRLNVLNTKNRVLGMHKPPGCALMERSFYGAAILMVEDWCEIILRAQRLINLEIPVLVRSLKASNVELG